MLGTVDIQTVSRSKRENSNLYRKKMIKASQQASVLANNPKPTQTNTQTHKCAHTGTHCSAKVLCTK